VTELRRAIERQASYLTDTSTNEARRRRSRLNLSERVNVVLLTFSAVAAREKITLVNGVDQEIRTPPLFRSELQAVLSNLISNAIKATQPGGNVAVFAVQDASGISIRVENTGEPVDVSNSERWFAPYASTSVASDPVLGQGMGLGLPITRDFVAEYGGTVRFVEPSEHFDTAVEVRLPR
jgi:signal transduction histidine kinase